MSRDAAAAPRRITSDSIRNADHRDHLERPLPGNSSYDLNFINPDFVEEDFDDPEELEEEWETFWDRFPDGDFVADDEEWSYERLLELDKRIERNNGLKPQALAALPIVVFGEMARSRAGVRSCAICLDAFAEADRLRDLPCKHFFHDVCIRTWLREEHRCPVCRYNLKEGCYDED